MIPRPHRLTRSELAALAMGGGGFPIVRTLVATRRSRTLLLIRYLVGASGHDERVLRAYEVLRQVSRLAPRAVDRIADDPFVGAWAIRTATGLRQGRPAAPEWLAYVAAAAAVHGRVTATVTVPTAPRIPLPSLGTVLCAASGDVEVLCTADGTEVAGVRIPASWDDEAPAWRPVPRLAVEAHGRSGTFSLDPWSPTGLPPELHVAEDLDLPRWRDLTARAWHLLAHHHGEVAEELAAAVSVLSPLRAVPSGMTSATLDEFFGCLFLSPAPNPHAMAVTLAHELRHTKLVALMDLFPLVEPVPGERFYAPWRDDPRPVAGLLHGAYAFAGVAAFWGRQRHHETSAEARTHAHTEFARWRTAASTAARTLLASGRLTDVGTDFVTGMAGVLQRWCAEPVPATAQRRAQELAEEHRSRWLAAHE